MVSYYNLDGIYNIQKKSYRILTKTKNRSGSLAVPEIFIDLRFDPSKPFLLADSGRFRGATGRVQRCPPIKNEKKKWLTHWVSTMTPRLNKQCV